MGELKRLEILLDNSINLGKYINAVSYCQDILKIYLNNNKNGKYKKEIDKYKKMIKEYTIKAPRSFEKFTFSTKVTNEELDKDFEEILTENEIEVIVEKIIKKYIIKRTHIETEVSNNSSCFLNIFTPMKFEENGTLIDGQNRNEEFNTTQTYILYLECYMLFMTELIQRLIDNQKFSLKILKNYFNSKKFIFASDDSQKKFKKGIERFFKKDYLSSFHILVPVLENTIIYISEGLGFDFIKVDEKTISTGTKALSNKILNDDNFINIWTEDFSMMLDIALFNELGKKLRHKLAHGEIGFEECNMKNNVMILLFFFFISKHVCTN